MAPEGLVIVGATGCVVGKVGPKAFYRKTISRRCGERRMLLAVGANRVNECIVH
jgi:hypothetical protein